MKDSVSLPELLYHIQCDRASFLGIIREGRLDDLIADDRIAPENVPLILACYVDRFKLHNKKWEIPEWLSSLQADWAQTLVAMYGEDVSFPASLPPSQGRQVRDLVLHLRPSNVVEVGCFIGVSSIWIGSALQSIGHGHLLSIDLFHDKYPVLPFHWGYLDNALDYARSKVKTARLADFVTFSRMKSGDYGKRVGQFSTDKIDFLFLDGDHTVGGCIDDFISYYPYVKEGGTILLHDIYPQYCGWHGPRYLLDNVFADADLFEVSELSTEPNFGMAIVTKRKECRNFYPWRNAKYEFMRQVHRSKTACGYSPLYQNCLKPAYLSLHSLYTSLTKKNLAGNTGC